jgi:hypothetical protein
MKAVMRLAAPVLFGVALTACGGGEDAAQAPAETASPPDATDTEQAPAAPPAPAATSGSTPETVPAGTGSVTGFHGFGPARFGDDEEAVRIAWGRPLVFNPAPTADAPCGYLVPEHAASGDAGIAFMFDGDRFVRYDVSDDQYEAPGTGRVGNTVDALQALYPGHVLMPHKYVEGGRYLVTEAPGGEAKLVFELDAAGVVTQWRVGLPPQVDQVEGCS